MMSDTTRMGAPGGAVTSGGTVRVALVEDEVLLRRLLEGVLHGREGVRVVHSVGGCQEAGLVLKPGSADVAVVDVNLGDGNGITLGLELQRADPQLGIVLLSSRDSMGMFIAAQSGMTKPWSYLSKRSVFTATVLVEALRATVRGEPVVDPYLVHRSTPRDGTRVADLSAAQFNVLSLVAEGLSNEAVASRLSIRVRSVENHLLAIYRTLKVQDNAQNRRVAATLAFLEQSSRRAV
jgi:DNA-binding NarL/FixJ family response regulator